MSPDSKRKTLAAAENKRKVLAVMKVDVRDMPRTLDSEGDSDEQEVTLMVRHEEMTVQEAMEELKQSPVIQRKKEKQSGALRMEFGMGEEVQSIRDGTTNANIYQLKLFNGFKAAEGASQGVMRAKICGPKKAKQDQAGSPTKKRRP